MKQGGESQMRPELLRAPMTWLGWQMGCLFGLFFYFRLSSYVFSVYFLFFENFYCLAEPFKKTHFYFIYCFWALLKDFLEAYRGVVLVEGLFGFLGRLVWLRQILVSELLCVSMHSADKFIQNIAREGYSFYHFCVL